jgi:hypothetical protein
MQSKKLHIAKRASGLSQQIAADAAGISVRSAQRIDRAELHCQGQQQQGRHWLIRSDLLTEVRDSVLVPMPETDPQLKAQTLLIHL